MPIERDDSEDEKDLDSVTGLDDHEDDDEQEDDDEDEQEDEDGVAPPAPGTIFFMSQI